MKRTWREAATLIVIARDATKNVKFDYKVLTFMRTEKTSFMPHSICFPGGATDKTDETKDWIGFLKKHKVPLSQIERAAGVRKPFIYDSRDGCIEREISLRITAIRETFEELGVVLCRDQSAAPTSPFSSYFHSKDCDIPLWQEKIHSRETKDTLMDFCEKFKVVPDVTNVHEWSCWLTPTFFRPKRYETAFFLVALNSIPPIYPEEKEVQEFRWETPDELLRLYAEKKLWLPPPQFVELRRMSTIGSIDELVELAKSRNSQHMDTIMPLQYKTKSGFLHVLPGDDLYPEHPNFHESSHDVEKYSEKSFKEMREMATNLCRSEQSDLYDVKLLSNVPASDGHISLVSDPLAKL